MAKVYKARLSTEEKRSLCEAWQASGLSKRSFCRQQDITSATLVSWCHRFLAKQPKTEPKSKPQLHKEVSLPKKDPKPSHWSPAIRLSKETPFQEHSTVEVKLPNQILLRFSAPLSAITLLIQELCDATAVIR